MKYAFVIVPLLYVGAAAQVPLANVPQAVTKQPIVRDTLAVGGEPLRAAAGWALTPDGEVVSDGVVAAHGPGARIMAGTATTLFRPQWRLEGTFTIGALFESSQPSAIYGLTVGGARGIAFLVRADGAFAVQAIGGASSAGTWTPVALRNSVDGRSIPNRLEVRVGSTAAVFLVNGQIVRSVPILSGQLDGVPGVHVHAPAEVLVAGFTIESAVPVLPTGGK